MATTAGERVRVVSLLDADPEFADALPEAQRAEARTRALAVVWRIDAGSWTPPPADALAHSPVGLLLLEGVAIRDTTIGARTAAQLVGPGELIDPWLDGATMLEHHVRWTVVEPLQAALIDDRLLTAVRPWPQIAAALVERVARQEARQAIVQAICQLSRVEDRIIALLWLLADRWGRMGRDGVILPLKLTHALLGDVVGAARPTVSLALHALDRDGLVQRRADGAWLLAERGRPVLSELTGAPARRQSVRQQPWAPLAATAVRVPEPSSEDMIGRLSRLRGRAREAVLNSRATMDVSTRLCRRVAADRVGRISRRP